MTAIDQLQSPTHERLTAANDNYVITPGGPARMQDAPIARLLRAGTISESQAAAADAYFADYYAAGMSPLGAVDYERVLVDGSKPGSTSDFRLGAQDRFNRSRRLLGTFFGVVVDMVVLHEQGIEAAGRRIGINNASQARAVGLDRLRGGLDILAARR